MRVLRRILLVSALLLAGCATLSTGVDYDRAATFGGYQRFAWLPREHAHTRNPLNVERVRAAIRAELEAKGLTFTEELAAADLAVDFTLSSAERTDITTYPVEFRGGWGWGWGYGYFGDQVDVRQYREGTLAIDLFDARAHRPIWHGWAKKPLERRDLTDPGPPLRAAVAAVLAQYPPPPPR
ncbi:MAG: DUF4136 domain-containing protein [Proteobacteria bacterium]|nr:DUF4136 domain-containing protein [Pseudomonadota bacterium]